MINFPLIGAVQTNRFAPMTRTPLGFYEWRGGASRCSLPLWPTEGASSFIFHCFAGASDLHSPSRVKATKSSRMTRCWSFNIIIPPNKRTGLRRLSTEHRDEFLPSSHKRADRSSAGAPLVYVCKTNKQNIYINVCGSNRDRIMNVPCWSGGSLERKTARVSRCCCC